jgi:hypothetical protein
MVYRLLFIVISTLNAGRGLRNIVTPTRNTVTFFAIRLP